MDTVRLLRRRPYVRGYPEFVLVPFADYSNVSRISRVELKEAPAVLAPVPEVVSLHSWCDVIAEHREGFCFESTTLRDDPRNRSFAEGDYRVECQIESLLLRNALYLLPDGFTADCVEQFVPLPSQLRAEKTTRSVEQVARRSTQESGVMYKQRLLGFRFGSV